MPAISCWFWYFFWLRCPPRSRASSHVSALADSISKSSKHGRCRCKSRERHTAWIFNPGWRVLDFCFVFLWIMHLNLQEINGTANRRGLSLSFTLSVSLWPYLRDKWKNYHTYTYLFQNTAVCLAFGAAKGINVFSFRRGVFCFVPTKIENVIFHFPSSRDANFSVWTYCGFNLKSVK